MFDEDAAQQEILHRNLLRAQAGLPPVDTASELAKMRLTHAEAEFLEFLQSSPLRPRVEAKVLAVMRRRINQPDWVPCGLLNGGLAFSSRVQELMRRIYRMRA